ncbi:MAG: hypothetical protein ABSF70_05880 [Terracidiphilus sp.]|jgi:hypothetical protein
MERSRTFPALLAVTAIALVCVPFWSKAQEAQTDQDVSTPQPRHIRKADKRPMPFPPGDETSGPAPALEFRSYDQMTSLDRDLAANAESSIEERAGFEGLEFNQGKWSYRQVVCAALPNHLFLQFTRNNGTGDVSVFSASIPRTGDGRVRIIPVLRRGYSLFSPAPVNARTISAFNHIRDEEHIEATPQWLATGLCYAALAGAHPQIGPPEETDLRKLPSAPTGTEVIPLNGGAVIQFTDVALPKPTLWTMTFNGKGKLLKATHSRAPRSGGKAVERKPSDPTANAILFK